MPPLFLFQRSGPQLAGSFFASGSLTPDNAASRIVVTGLATPIRLVIVSVDKGTASLSALKIPAMTGRRAFGATTSITGGSQQDGIGLVNGGIDFDIQNADYWAFNSYTANTLYWAAWG